MAAPKSVVEPHKELRFTRIAQAQSFMVIATVSFAFCLLLTVTWLLDHPSFRWWMPLPFLLLAIALGRLSGRCARHAYLILTPLGIEVFPLLKPQDNLNLVYWTQIEEAEFNGELTLLKLHYNVEKSAGLILSLKPIPPKKRHLLKEALLGRMAEKKRVRKPE